jgi:GntR family transcriptional regulator/MocR family aminotransferase
MEAIMARKTSGALLPGLDLDPSADTPLATQLYDSLRYHISEGTLAAGVRMPSTRTLSTELGMSRTTVAGAYDQLKSEGYLTSEEKSGTFVADLLPEKLAWSTQLHYARPDDLRQLEPDLAARFDDNLPKQRERTSRTLPFNPGIPAVFEFPSQTWIRIMRPILSQLAPNGIARCPAEGSIELREEVSRYLSGSRGVTCSPEQVLIISGTRQALTLIMMALANQGDTGWVEDPGYPGISRVYDLFRVGTVPVPVDAHGLVVEEAIERAPHSKFAYVTPARQAPLGHTMSIRRRIELLNWAYASEAFILEDDYDGEYRFGGHPAPSLQSLDPEGRVFYFGTFSKTVLPSLGLGYLVVPTRYVDVFRNLLDAITRPPSLATQLTMAEFMASGLFEAHIRKMRTLYLSRQNALSAVLRKSMPDLLESKILNAGLHLIGYLPKGYDDAKVARRAKDLGLLPRPLSDYVHKERLPPGLLIGFSNIKEEAMARTVRVLRRAIEDCQPETGHAPASRSPTYARGGG